MHRAVAYRPNNNHLRSDQSLSLPSLSSLSASSSSSSSFTPGRDIKLLSLYSSQRPSAHTTQTPDSDLHVHKRRDYLQYSFDTILKVFLQDFLVAKAIVVSCPSTDKPKMLTFSPRQYSSASASRYPYASCPPLPASERLSTRHHAQRHFVVSPLVQV